ncbi:FAD-binding domain-containing protein [Maricaulis sp.]|uniref:FAD-binding domain-containing protein n=1 Tax=Maricaulis sp. TaxID=1486257 RepID=UPI0026287C21|nr:FAD-binding domain-containing protein [Maricaulis sp.]
MTAQLQIVWFKRDLRVEDHEALRLAAAAGPVLPLYIIEPDYWALPDTSGRQYTFLLEALDKLSQQLCALGAPLQVRTGEAVDVLSQLFAAHPGCRLVSHEETGNQWTYQRDTAVAARAREAGVDWIELPPGGVIRRLKSRNGWAGRWDKDRARPLAGAPAFRGLTIEPEPVPDAGRLGLARDACPHRQRGGRSAALQALNSFLTERGAPYRKAMSAPEAGAKHCSRISPYLALGTLSMRETAQAGWARQGEIAARGERGGWSGSMRSFLSRLHWRDHFMQKLEDEPEIEWRDMHPGLEDLRPREADPDILGAWERGETGVPFVDACMRCLQATGWMNFRMRAMLVSFASYHLWQPWQATGERLARLFTDYEPGIHWSQVQMQSGTTGVNSIRIYNPVKQGLDQDPDARFIRRWLPELEAVPADFIHEVWRWPGFEACLDGHYPRPLVKVTQAAREARDRVFAARKQPGFKDASKKVLARHGSRAPMRRRSGALPPANPGNQLQLDL